MAGQGVQWDKLRSELQALFEKWRAEDQASGRAARLRARGVPSAQQAKGSVQTRLILGAKPNQASSRPPSK